MIGPSPPTRLGGSRQGASIPTFSTLNPSEAVYQVFDFASEALHAQRRLVDFSIET
ncbi:hypothetical protein MXD63_32905 [Frankia sp. Cpl3]|uniref:hypothetical protein n=1 Tax=Parafrankia colletiae TaxID=573497 RepID=UPI0012FFAF9C|nr:hypothetical protein [Parafrankia colletiae]MCK9904821.1 hypothetical protein [Frankia sp. Cpl3]